MLGSFWGNHKRAGDGEITPKASSHPERNPFEHSLGLGASSTGRSDSSQGNNRGSGGSSSGSNSGFLPLSRKNSAASTAQGGVGGGVGVGGIVPSSAASSISNTGLRTPTTISKSFVLPEASSVTATGSHTINTNTSAASSLHHSPVHTVGGGNRPGTPSRQHSALSNPYPQPPASPRASAAAASKSSMNGGSGTTAAANKPEFKLSQPPISHLSHQSPLPSPQISSIKNSEPQQQQQQQRQPQSSTPSSPASTSRAATPTKAHHPQPLAPAPVPSSNNVNVNPTNVIAAAGSKKRSEAASSSLKGKLTVKIMEAKDLSAPSPRSRPYVVATFEQNEFVSREAINEHDGDAYGVPVSPQSSSQMRQRDRGNTGNPGGAKNGNGGTDSPEEMDTSTASAFNPVWKHEVAFDVTLDNSPVTVCVYDRTEGAEETFLGLVDIKPRLSHGWNVDEWYTLHPRQDEQVTGQVRVRMSFERSEVRRSLRASDFEFLRMIGKGTFGRVFQVRKKDTKRIYAMKVLSKKEIIAKKEVQHTIGERKILQKSSECPFLLGLKFSFQSETELFLVMDFKSGGELFHHLQKEGRFTEDRARFYAAEITLAFEYLHKYNIVYRDLKPENILLDATGHIVLCDFGLSKPDLPSDALTNTFCGTTEYLAPEVLLDDHGYSQTVDFWSLGVLLFEMCCGWSPFYAEDTQQMYKNICFGKIKFPRGVIGDDGKQFVKGLLNRNPAHRLGAKRDAAELKEHPFFKMIDWEALAARQVTVPFKPFVDSDESVSNFDAEFTEADIHLELPIDTNERFETDDPSWLDHPNSNSEARPAPVPINPSRDRMNGAGAGPLDEQAQDAFRGFSYSGDMDLHDLMMQASLQEEESDFNGRRTG